MANPVSQRKAKEILRHGEVHGQPLTQKQRGLFGAIAGGQKLTRTKSAHGKRHKSYHHTSWA